MKQIHSKTILFVPGAYVHHSCWNNWIAFFESKGYKAIAPPWPHKDAAAETLRMRHPDKALAKVTMYDVLNAYIDVLQKLPEKPIIIGHSFGGLFAQVLLSKGYGAAGVAIHAVPPQGVFPYEINFLKSNAPLLGLLSSADNTYLMPFKKWQFVFTNGMTLDEQERSYDELIIPESRRAARGGLTSAAHVDFAKDHEPLLILAGSDDHCIPAHLCERVYNRYKSKHSVTDFQVKKRNHFVLGQSTWQQDANFILDWLKKN